MERIISKYPVHNHRQLFHAVDRLLEDARTAENSRVLSDEILCDATLLLKQETLIDGSKVYNIEVRL